VSADKVDRIDCKQGGSKQMGEKTVPTADVLITISNCELFVDNTF